jgi:hypothetical protein
MAEMFGEREADRQLGLHKIRVCLRVRGYTSIFGS